MELDTLLIYFHILLYLKYKYLSSYFYFLLNIFVILLLNLKQYYS